jgi:hypothetical protein
MENTKTATKRKTKRKLSDIDFSGEGSHIALVSKQQGGPAHGADYALILKANKFSEEFVQKMQQVRVTMELPEFLRKFFSLYGEDAEILARMMGYEKPEQTTDEMPSDYEDYIQSRLEAFEILKSAEQADNLAEVLSELDEHEYLAMLNDQALIEKAMEDIAKAQKESALAATAEGTDTSTNAGVENIEGVSTSVNKQELEKSKMEDEVKVETVLTVEKAQFELVQKALDEQKVQLQKALETIAVFEAEKKAAINKAKTDQIKAIVKDESKVEAIAKAALSLESEDDFTAFVAAMQAMMTIVETSEMFVEKGASTQEEPVVKESAVAKLLKAKQVTK